MQTRINHGNGQVTGSFRTIKQCIAALHQYGCGWMERRDADTGEWFPCDGIRGVFIDMTAQENADHPAK